MLYCLSKVYTHLAYVFIFFWGFFLSFFSFLIYSNFLPFWVDPILLMCVFCYLYAAVGEHEGLRELARQLAHTELLQRWRWTAPESGTSASEWLAQTLPQLAAHDVMLLHTGMLLSHSYD